ncbi:hypothetical protein HPP92_004462 [Vanilla planifolia]|uniref:Uncharacterized protein n=1 Tax=Vanilla planifolia TaxID=51239 RepID=A0A835S4F3_VANPL|nr:hypothetical protein HPP92_004462 [Vanilla planifolia]
MPPCLLFAGLPFQSTEISTSMVRGVFFFFRLGRWKRKLYYSCEKSPHFDLRVSSSSSSVEDNKGDLLGIPYFPPYTAPGLNGTQLLEE